MNYQKIHDRIIDRAKNRKLDCYKERHHIIPRCMGGTDDSFNLVDLTPEEHYVCHQLLVKIYPNNSKLVYATLAMSMAGPNNRFRSNKIYGWLRRKVSEAASQRKKDKITLQCKSCKLDFLVYPCNIHRLYCSRECKSKDNKITKNCPACNSVFIKVKSKETTYCGKVCARSFATPPSQKGKLYGERITRNCLICSKPFTKLKCKDNMSVYCSKECITQSKKVTYECKNCKKEFLGYKSVLRSFCSTSCKYSYNSTT
jgi:hypothetical protein